MKYSLKEYKNKWNKEQRRKKLLIPRICKGCNKKYIAKDGHQKFCTIKCSKLFFQLKNSDNHNRRNHPMLKSVFKFRFKDRDRRVCLKCQHLFPSLGSFNRVCKHCKGSMDYDKGNIINALS